jgi:hypothetical protein
MIASEGIYPQIAIRRDVESQPHKNRTDIFHLWVSRAIKKLACTQTTKPVVYWLARGSRNHSHFVPERSYILITNQNMEVLNIRLLTIRLSILVLGLLCTLAVAQHHGDRGFHHMMYPAHDWLSSGFTMWHPSYNWLSPGFTMWHPGYNWHPNYRYPSHRYYSPYFTYRYYSSSWLPWV